MTAPGEKPKVSILRAILPIFLIIAVAVAALWIIQMRQAGSRGSGSADSEINEGTSASVISLGATVEDFELTDLNGKKTKFSELKDKVYLINFWASWCEACMVEMPSIVRLRSRLHSQGFEVLGINVDDSPTTVVPNITKKLGIEFPIFIDSDQKLADLFDVHAIPLTVILNKDRKVLFIEPGERNWNNQASFEMVSQWLSQ